MMNIEANANNAGSESQPMKILLVDDQPIIYEALRRILAAATDLELHYCQKGVDAVRVASEIQPSVILQDLVMPDVDGLMLVKFYGANELTRDIPIVVLSSKDEATTKADAFSSGASDYLVKLPEQIELLARLRYHAKVHATILERNEALEELRRMSSTDGLTGLNNRRHFDDVFGREWKLALRNKTSISVIMIDVDHFKQFNDNYGHQAGDDCLIKVAQAFKGAFHRPTDVAARYGGEEFVAILPDTGKDGALKLAEIIRLAVSDLGIPHAQSSAGDYVTVSLGVATISPPLDENAEKLLKAADDSLYQAKENGRNQTIACEL